MDTTRYTRITAGACGSIWVYDFPKGSAYRNDSPQGMKHTVVKLEGGGRDKGHLQNDYDMNTKVQNALADIRTQHGITIDDFHIPSLVEYKSPRHCPRSDLESYEMQRIYPVTLETRWKYLQLYHDHLTSAEQNEALAGSRDCLIRLYLGKRGATGRSLKRVFSMTNPPLYWPEASSLHLWLGMPDPVKIAGAMGKMLAVMHWMAGVDGNDVEVALGAARGDMENEQDPVLWLFDFDCCHDMQADEAGVQQAIKAYFRNDPYFPRPDPAWLTGWLEFMKQYLELSGRIQKEVKGVRDPLALTLPQRFITGIVERYDMSELAKWKLRSADYEAYEKDLVERVNLLERVRWQTALASTDSGSITPAEQHVQELVTATEVSSDAAHDSVDDESASARNTVADKEPMASSSEVHTPEPALDLGNRTPCHRTRHPITRTGLGKRLIQAQDRQAEAEYQVYWDSLTYDEKDCPAAGDIGTEPDYPQSTAEEEMEMPKCLCRYGAASFQGTRTLVGLYSCPYCGPDPRHEASQQASAKNDPMAIPLWH
ncbi:hypothetical protein LTR85_005923 [Meristemomyces frigidus]|nr:hypothetical protein LTR85_005923 [Meristemomyces frigidus]